MACYRGEYSVSEDRFPESRKWRPLIHRKCTDKFWLIIFFLFWAGLMFITGYAVTAGATERLIFGYDSYGNVCGRRNTPVVGAPLSGQDMRNKKFVFYLNACGFGGKNFNIKNIRSIALCVSSCPQEQLNYLEDIQLFANNNGSCLCVYSLNASSCIHGSKASELCPALPVPPSLSFPLFNRCIPRNVQCYSNFAPVLIDVVNEVDYFHRILGGLMAGRDTVTGLCILSLVLSALMMLSFRCINMLVVHIFLTLFVFGLLFVSGVMWWLYYNNSSGPSIELETEKENMKLLYGLFIISSVIAVILIVLIVLLRKKIHFIIQLFQVANKIIGKAPFLYFQPIWTFVILIVFWVYWVAVLLSLGTAGSAQVISGGQVKYKIRFGIRYMWWYHLLGLIWTSEFILACQQMTVAGTVVACFFNRNKSKLSSHPILCSISVLFCYHLGTVVKGSLIIPLMRVPRIILLSLYNFLKNKNAYAATIINGTNFCTSAKDASVILSKNVTSTMAVNSFSDFAVFLAKVFVACFTVFGGLMAFNYHQELKVWALPLLLVAVLAYFIAHNFLSVFQTTVDVLFLCFAVDVETNDGSSDKPYLMDQDLMNFVYQNSKLAKIKERNRRIFYNNEYNIELQLMS
ncbi:choline transporter-like protein 3 isoform X2 [Ahaetulla prasina]|uniref:choline transporter-like protein 3 isoform X2 n=1 Tax=Ahaetulla prasina TaxID=499056 RepID=UPI002649413B|nr:choline transporter-like protein 3 isoform X2 [Ahaetulla prasina]